MRLYLLDDPAKPGVHARFSHVGTWADDAACGVCGESRAHLVEPLQIEWNEGTTEIGDFSWGGYNTVVLDTVRTFLEGNGFESRFGVVEVLRPEKKTGSRPRVPFPYRGPRLHWLIPTRRLDLDARKSGLAAISDCSACGQRRYQFQREGLWVKQSSWQEEKLFRISQFGRSSATFVTEAGRVLLASAGFTNLSPRPAGEII